MDVYREDEEEPISNSENATAADSKQYSDNSFKSKFARTFVFIQYPWSVWFIISNELCERFSFYGFKTILSKYMVDFLKFDEDNATAVVHAFVFAAYFTPLLGGFMADALIGKFWTIFSLSVVYCIGQVVVSVTAIQGVTGTPPHWWGCALGLLLVALGTGGIKPCVSSFGGDQFREDQTELLMSFFAIFYFSINLGSTVSSFVTPIFRNLWGYAVAFAIPAALLIVATIIFLLGKRTYRMVPPSGIRNNPYFTVFGVIYHALKNWRNPHYRSVRSWLDRAEAKYSRDTVYDVKCVLGVVKVLLPIIVFWSLFDQHATRFVFQADRMNRKVGGYEFTADQVTTLNPLMVISMVIVFDRVIYRGLDYIGLSPRPLKRIAVGFIFTTLSFISAAVVEIFVVRNDSPDGMHRLHLAWQLPQWILLCIGEILVSVTGLELAYSQAPKSMKSFMQSYYLLTVSIGNMIVVAVAKAGLPKKYVYRQVYEFLFFAGLMTLALVLFIFLASSYKYRRIVDETTNSPVAMDTISDEEQSEIVA